MCDSRTKQIVVVDPVSESVGLVESNSILKIIYTCLEGRALMPAIRSVRAFHTYIISVLEVGETIRNMA